MSGVGYYGCKRDTHDHRDLKKVYMYDMVPSSLQHPNVDLRRYVHHVYDQGNLGSCTANAVCAAYGFDLKKQSQAPHTLAAVLSHRNYSYFDSSRLFLYYNTRKIENKVLEDSGASIRDTIKSLKRDGVCEETFWPYRTDKFAQAPPPNAYLSAKGNVASKYESLHQDIDQFRACLKENCPFVFGFEVFKSFSCYANCHYGEMPMPTPNDSAEGRHAVMAVGYDDKRKRFIVLNSWGENWGDKGYFYMPYDFIKDPALCFSFWKITYVEESTVPTPGMHQLQGSTYMYGQPSPFGQPSLYGQAQPFAN